MGVGIDQAQDSVDRAASSSNLTDLQHGHKRRDLLQMCPYLLICPLDLFYLHSKRYVIVPIED